MQDQHIETTADGSPTVYSQRFQQTYHSRHGAVQESRHVFIEAGLIPAMHGKTLVHVFEMGLGTGLNAWLTQQMAEKHQVHVEYHTVEAFPVSVSVWEQLSYQPISQTGQPVALDAFHRCAWTKPIQLSPYFLFTKYRADLSSFSAPALYEVIYYDAFAPNAQPELWTTAVFRQLFDMAGKGCLLTTYCSKGEVRRNMAAAGWQVQKLPGPPGKREMVRAVRPA